MSCEGALLLAWLCQQLPWDVQAAVQDLQELLWTYLLPCLNSAGQVQ